MSCLKRGRLLLNFLKSLKRNPLDALLDRWSREGKETLFIVWNRGLGDIALGLYALVYRIREKLPNLSIVFVTRTDLADGFALLPGVEAIPVPWMQRGQAVDAQSTLSRLNLERGSKTALIESINADQWLSWQIGKLVPRLAWKSEWESLCQRFALPSGRSCRAFHVSSETQAYYGYRKDWPLDRWCELAAALKPTKESPLLLFGHRADTAWEGEGIVDLRGQTALLELLALLVCKCRALVAPDSGILSLAYYIGADFPLRVVSLWSDPRQGILKQAVASPNPSLVHLPLIAHEKNRMESIAVADVLRALGPAAE